MIKQPFVLVFLFFVAAVFMAACSGQEILAPGEAPLEDPSSTPVEGVQPTAAVEASPPTEGAVEQPYPEPGEELLVESTPELGGEPYPEPAEPGVPQNVPPPNDHEYAPQPQDAALERGNVYIDSAEVVLMESYPVQVRLLLQGSLPTPCHLLRAVASISNDRIEVEVYSLVDPAQICTQVLQPFDASIPLGAYTQGSFSVWVNEQEAGTFDLP
jgi:hypothetical protein